VDPPEPLSVEGLEVEAQLLPADAGVDPAAMLETVEGSP
jgi:hypothetical protein